MKKGFIKAYVIICIIGVVVVFIWFMNIVEFPNMEFEKAINAYKNQKYSGTVLNKFIDRNEHNFHKIILHENGRERTILLDIEIGGLYKFIQLGDSIIKKENELFVHIIREDLDTLYEMKFITSPHSP